MSLIKVDYGDVGGGKGESTYSGDILGGMTTTLSDNYDVLTVVASGYNTSATISNIKLALNGVDVPYNYAKERSDSNTRALLIWILKDVKVGDVVAFSGSVGSAVIYGETY